MTPVLEGGLWLWIWPEARAVSPRQVADLVHATGAAGVIVHAVGTAKSSLDWIAKAPLVEFNDKWSNILRQKEHTLSPEMEK